MPVHIGNIVKLEADPFRPMRLSAPKILASPVMCPSTAACKSDSILSLPRDDQRLFRTGWNAVRSRAAQLGLHMTDDQVKEV